LLRICQCQN